METEAALRQAEERYRKIFENAVEGIFQTTPEGRYTIANPALARIYGFDSPEQLMTAINDIGTQIYVKSEDRIRLLKTVEERGSVENYEIEQFRRDGTKIWTSSNARAVRDEHGKTLYYEGTIQDITKRKEAEEALQASEERYRVLVENSADGIFLTEPNGNVCAANAAACRIFGYSEEELCRRGREAVMLPDDSSLSEALAERARSGVFKGELNFRRADGTVFPADVSSTVFKDAAGRQWTSTIVRDITERERANRQIELLKYAIDTNYDGVYWMDRDNRFVYINETGCRMLGYECEELLGRTLDLVNPRATPEAANLFWERLLKYGSFSSETVHRRKDGSEFAVEIVATYVKFEGKEYNCGFARDITARKQAEEALRTSEQRLQAFLDASPLAISWADAEGNVLYCNRKFYEIFGYTLQDIPTVADWRRLAYPDPAYRETIPSILSAYKEGGETRPYESTITCKDGSRRQTIVYGAAISNMVLLIVNDVTERKHLESQLQQAQKMEAIGHLAGGVAHDFNNILTAIIGFGTIIQMGLEADSQNKVYIEEILRAAERAARLTQSLLTFSRKQTIQPVLLNLNESIENQKNLLERLIGEDVNLITNLSEKPLIVKVDPGQLDQVVMNIVTNARDAMPNGGEIAIGTRLTKIDDGFIASHGYGAPGAYALLTVSDTGTGMDQQVLENIFNPFFTTKEVGKGTGLGLSVVYGIVKQHNGYIEVKSKVGIGTTFLIYFPAARQKVSEEKKAPVQLAAGYETILLAEDEEGVRALMRTILEKAGYTVMEAGDGNSALRMFEENVTIDLVLLDVVLPGMNGKEVYERIKKMKPGQKVLFSSGYAEEILTSKGVLQDGLAFISKPIKPLDFLKKVRSVLDS